MDFKSSTIAALDPANDLPALRAAQIRATQHYLDQLGQVQMCAEAVNRAAAELTKAHTKHDEQLRRLSVLEASLGAIETALFGPEVETEEAGK